jgi:hypothetical protein
MYDVRCVMYDVKKSMYGVRCVMYDVGKRFLKIMFYLI